MSEKIDTMKAFAQVGFNRLERATENLTEEQLDWKSCPEANTIRWILTHMNSEFFAFFPKIVKADKDYVPEGWPADYVGNKSYSLDKIMGDHKKGKENVLKLLSGLKEQDLKKDTSMAKQKITYSLLKYIYHLWITILVMHRTRLVSQQ